MIMGPAGWGLGNRVVGATGPMHSAVAINPKTGAVDPAGVMLNPATCTRRSRNFLESDPPTRHLDWDTGVGADQPVRSQHVYGVSGT